MQIDKNSNLWGGITLTVYVAAIGFMVYLYYRDSKKSLNSWRDSLNSFTTNTGHAMNGKVDERTASATVEGYRNDSAESDAPGV